MIKSKYYADVYRNKIKNFKLYKLKIKIDKMVNK
jgi:hypothetical protein